MGTIDRQWDQLDWDDVRVFLAVAEAGSYRRAAALRGPTPTVSGHDHRSVPR